MDCSWLHDDVDVDGSDEESDPEEIQAELEARLYAIVHHNDLSQPLPPELAKHYSVDCVDNGELIVTLKNSLEDIKSEECGKIDGVLNSDKSNDELLNGALKFQFSPLNDSASDDANNANTIGEKFKPHRRFRYSDVNIDQSNETQLNQEIDASTPHINYFKIGPSFFHGKGLKHFNHLVVPSSYKYSDWKTDANESFISIGPNSNGGESEILEKMTNALLKVNPGEKRKKLFQLAYRLYKRNIKRFKKKEKNKRKKVINISNKSDLSHQIHNSSINYVQDNFVNHQRDGLRVNYREKFNGSISLNISPFKPNPPTIDLVSDDELNSHKQSVDSTHDSPAISRKNFQCHLPNKWTREMIDYYSKPSQKKRKMNLDGIIANLKRTTVAADWRLDATDHTGSYQIKSPGKQTSNRKRKCLNCNERGHMAKDCSKPKKIPACSLCGEYFHSNYSCPNKICLKCGVFISSNAYSDECNTCYFSNFDYDIPCSICSKVTHRSAICPDYWRSFHATTSGEKKIPEKTNKNERIYCCNCARKGHFSHDCPFVTYIGQQTSSFVSNYSANPLEKGTTEIVIPSLYSDIVNTYDADVFLQNLSNSTNAQIEVDTRDSSSIFKINGTFEQCKRVQNEIEGYVNTRKRKRVELLSKKQKKQRLKF